MHPGIGGKFLKTGRAALMGDGPPEHGMAQRTEVRLTIIRGNYREGGRGRGDSGLGDRRPIDVGGLGYRRRWRGGGDGLGFTTGQGGQHEQKDEGPRQGNLNRGVPQAPRDSFRNGIKKCYRHGQVKAQTTSRQFSWAIG